MRDETYKKGQVVFWQGDPGYNMYYIKWGSVGVYTDYATSKQRELAVLWRGDYFGEMGLIDNAPRSATVVVLERDTQLVSIGEDEFKDFLKENPHKVYEIMVQLSHKLRNITREYRDVCRTLHEKIGTTDIDGTTELGLGSDERLMEIHDRVEAEDAGENA